MQVMGGGRQVSSIRRPPTSRNLQVAHSSGMEQAGEATPVRLNSGLSQRNVRPLRFLKAPEYEHDPS